MSKFKIVFVDVLLIPLLNTVKIVLDAQYLGGDELQAYVERYRGNKAKLRCAGLHSNQLFNRSYHIEYQARPLALLSQRMHAMLMH